MIKKADIVLFLCIVVFGLAISWHAAFFDRQGNEVVVTAGGQVFGVYPLAEDREIEVTQSGHSNHITIKDGKVSMTSSTCKNLRADRYDFSYKGQHRLSSQQSHRRNQGRKEQSRRR